MSDANPFISNGTCYYGAGEESPGNVLPCGNAALGTIHCCSSGDMCLEDPYCLDEGMNRTYTAACTDPTYEDAKCNDQTEGSRWSSVLFCVQNSSPGSVILTLTYCKDSGAPPTSPGFNECLCPSADEEGPYFVNNSYYDEVALLPSSTGQSVVWQPGHVPTSSGESSSVSETGAGATVTIVSSGNGDNGGDDDGGGAAGLGLGAIAGIGVGVFLAAVFAIGVTSLLFRRRAKGHKAAATANVRRPDDVAELPVRPGTPPPGELEADTSRSGLAGAGPPAERRWSGEKNTGGVGGDRAGRTASVVSELP